MTTGSPTSQRPARRAGPTLVPDARALPRALRPLALGEVRFTSGLWAEMEALNHDAVIEHCEHWVERVGWVANFDRAAAGTEFEHAGIEFTDSEVYKLLEAMAIEIDRTSDDDLERRFTALVERVAAAQDEDGYLHTSFGRPWQPARYSNLQWGHELYCFGHLFQAAAARVRSGRGGLLPEVAARLADHVYDTLGPQGREAICGHPEIEPALTELARATGERRYLELAALFVERRGHGLLGDVEWGRGYFQDDVPVREATVLRGHAVRALYLSAGALDVAVDTGDDELFAAVTRQYDHALARRTYITGGVGSHHQDEAFGEDFELPPDRAYAETCAAIASVLVAQRLLTATGDPEYADVVERTLLNAVMCSPRADGRAFFYSNSLHQRTTGEVVAEDSASPRATSSQRAPWFDVSCCPTNLARTLASLSTYVAAMGPDGPWLHQYGSYSVRTTDDQGCSIAFDVESDYPHEGRVAVCLLSGLVEGQSLTLRIPAWADGRARLVVDGREQRVTGRRAVVAGPLPARTEVLLELPLEPRLVRADHRVDAVRGQVAVERGPLVLALEGVDLPFGGGVNDVALAVDEPLEVRADVVTALLLTPGDVTESPRRWPYGAGSSTDLDRRVRVPLRPYAGWGNRGPTTMRVFMPEARNAD